MLGWIFQVTVISLCFIAVIHYLYIFFKTTLTVPKVKDLVNRPQQQYEELFKGITNTNLVQQNVGLLPTNNNNNSTNNTTNISALPSLIDSNSTYASNYNTFNNGSNNNNNNNPQPQSAMKDELKQFLKKLNRT
jgi:hypothetical protein